MEGFAIIMIPSQLLVYMHPNFLNNKIRIFIPLIPDSVILKIRFQKNEMIKRFATTIIGFFRFSGRIRKFFLA